MTEKLIYKLTFYFLLLVLIILPFWPAFIELLTFRTGLSAGLVYDIRQFYEPVLIILFLVTVFNPVWEKKELKLKLVDWLILAYLLWAIASIFFSGESISQGLQGLRFNGLFFGFYLLGRYSFFSEHRVRVISRLVVILGQIVAFWAVAEALVLGSGYWQRFGLLPFTSSFGFGGAHKVVAVPQAMATLEGPNQLGSYLLLPFFLLLSRTKKEATDWLWLIVMALAIVLSFSRSAIIALAVGVAVYLVLNKKITWAKKGLITISCLAVLAVSLIIFRSAGGLTRDFFSHGTSTPQHLSSMLDTFKRERTTAEVIVGQGIGTAGPASFNFQPNIQESWYLQVLSEIGIVGLLLWLGIIILLLRDFFLSKCHCEESSTRQSPANAGPIFMGDSSIPRNDLRVGLTLALLSISVAAIFLHTFADNPSVAISLFIILGVYSSTNFREAKH